MPTTRGRLRGMDQLPEACAPLVATATAALGQSAQVVVYSELVKGLLAFRAEHPEVPFEIPSKSAFNRFAIRLAALHRRLEETRRIAAALRPIGVSPLAAADLLTAVLFETMTGEGTPLLDGLRAVAAAKKFAKAGPPSSTVH